LQSLQRRLPVEKIGTRFTIQPVLMEYVTEKLIGETAEEIRTGNIGLFNRHTLLKASAKSYVRETQARLILGPLRKRLAADMGSQKNAEEKLRRILSDMRAETPRKPGYAGGNILNLLCRMETDLKDYDFSRVCVWQAYLRETDLWDVNFAHADLSGSVFKETFCAILSVAFTPNGKYLIAGGLDGELGLWQISDGKKDWRIQRTYGLDQNRSLQSGWKDSCQRR